MINVKSLCLLTEVKGINEEPILYLVLKEYNPWKMSNNKKPTHTTENTKCIKYFILLWRNKSKLGATENESKYQLHRLCKLEFS